MPEGSTVGIDPYLTSPSEYNHRVLRWTQEGIKIKSLAVNPIDAWIWPERPAESLDPVFVHPLKYAGVSSKDKIEQIRKNLAAQSIFAHVVCALDDIACCVDSFFFVLLLQGFSISVAMTSNSTLSSCPTSC
jgi:Xaa-Pro aminopeptidase